VAVLEGGFRPFFLLAGLQGALSTLVWLLAYGGRLSLPAPWVPAWWHGHELVFGFAGAAICGFLLTAVPKWTGTASVRGAPLAVLVALWVAGRVAMALAGQWPPAAVAVADLLLLPAMAVAVGRPIVGARNVRNYAFPLLLVLLFVANGLMHLEALGVARTARLGLYLALYVVVVMVALVSGRIVPSFTASALARRGSELEVRAAPQVGRLAVGAVAVAAALQVVAAPAAVRGVAALGAAVLLLVRALGWRAFASRGEPILWVLHKGHAWLVVGFGLLAWAELVGGILPSVALHALSAGAIGTMVLAVMTRASLGHSGRPLRASRLTVVAYVLVTLGAAVRVFGPIVAPAGYMHAVLTGGALWAAAFAIFTVEFAPMLLKPRADGRPG
jgi:uncharacterized protein involved in response to NO